MTLEGLTLTCTLLDTVQEHFSALADPRRETKNQYHEFVDILVIALCGAICGANHWTSVATFGRAKESWFRGFLSLPNGIPSHDTFTDVFAKQSGVIRKVLCLVGFVIDEFVARGGRGD